MTPAVSIVVPTRDSARTLRACLASIRAQRDVEVELVVVDNQSSDGSARIAAEFADVVISAGPERSAQRNVGVASSRGQWVCWIDSDMVLPPDALARALDLAEREGTRTVAVPEVTVGDGYWTACRALERSCYVDHPGLHNPRLLRRELLEELGGFSEAMSGPEDADLRLRLRQRGEKMAYLRDVLIVHDEGRLTLRQVWRKRVYYGRTLPALRERHDGALRRQGAEVLAAYRRNLGRLLSDPVHLPGLVLMRATEAVGYLVGAAGARGARRDVS